MSDLDRVLGRSTVAAAPIRETTTTGDIAPVMTGGGLNGRPKRPGLINKRDKDRQRRTVASVIGATMESDEEDYERSQSDDLDGVIPDDAKEINTGDLNPSGIHVKEPEFKKRNPSTPSGGGNEEIMSATVALVAPDVTPDSMTEVDPSDVPGPTGTMFKVSDIPGEPTPEAAPHELPASPNQDKFTTAVDALLGRKRSERPMGNVPVPQTMESIKTPPISPEAASAMFSGKSGEELAYAPMPEHTPGDGKQILEAFRRFC